MTRDVANSNDFVLIFRKIEVFLKTIIQYMLRFLLIKNWRSHFFILHIFLLHIAWSFCSSIFFMVEDKFVVVFVSDGIKCNLNLPIEFCCKNGTRHFYRLGPLN